MRIDRNQPYVVNITGIKPPMAVTGATGTPQTGAAPSTGTTRDADRVVLSAKSREITRLKQALDELPEVRGDQVALAKQRMQNGGYRVDAAALAQKMVAGLKRG